MAHNRQHRREERKAKREAKRQMLEEQFKKEDEDTFETSSSTTIPEARLGGERLTLLNLIKKSK
jgi:hypothetical protein